MNRPSIPNDATKPKAGRILKEYGIVGFFWLLFDEQNGRTAWATIGLRAATLIVCGLALLLQR